MTSLDDAAATLRVIIPGFLALRVFYWRGLRTQRTDLELILWSLVLSVPLYWAALLVRPEDDTLTLAAAALWAILAGEVGAVVWQAVVRRWPWWREYMVATAWDGVLARPEGGWLQVRTTDGTTYQGWARLVADSAQTKDLDLYLWEPSYVGDDQSLTPLPGVEGVLLPRASIQSVIRFATDAPAAD